LPAGADSTEALLHQPDGLGIKTFKHFEKLTFRYFRYLDFNHHISPYLSLLTYVRLRKNQARHMNFINPPP